MRSRLPLSTDALCTKYANENAHTEHVTALALQLFDRTRSWLKLPAADRPLLEAAGRLHDVGYKIDPVRHAHVSTQIVARDGLKGFDETSRSRVAEIMSLHSGKWDARAVSRRARQLGAYLRVADGLDYSHVQDAAIVSVCRTRHKVLVSVRCTAFPYNVVRANQKADLWRSVQPLSIEFVSSPAQVVGAVRPHDPTVEATRRLIWIQYKTILINVAGAIEGKSSQPLHDIRVAIRRLRLLLRVFRKSLPQTSIDRAFSELGESLGPARDMDVWVDFLQRPVVQRETAGDRRSKRFLDRQLEFKRQQIALVRRHLTGHRFASLCVMTGRYLRIELPRLVKTSPPERGLKRFAQKKLAKELRRVRRRGHLRHSTSPQKLHELRIALRRARYLCEFFVPVLGQCAARLTQRLREVERPLGRIHDIDMALARIRRQQPVPPRSLLAFLDKRRQKQLDSLGRSWHGLARAMRRE
jgi:CHAD domain-containing protein